MNHVENIFMESYLFESKRLERGMDAAQRSIGGLGAMFSPKLMGTLH